MGSLSIVHWLVLVGVLVSTVIPPAKILMKAGYSGWWCLIGFVPIVNIIMLWVFAYADWPSLRKSLG
jgi:uncharacterized membrane protein YhaH (DUF805 family)